MHPFAPVPSFCAHEQWLALLGPDHNPLDLQIWACLSPVQSAMCPVLVYICIRLWISRTGLGSMHMQSSREFWIRMRSSKVDRAD